MNREAYDEEGAEETKDSLIMEDEERWVTLFTMEFCFSISFVQGKRVCTYNMWSDRLDDSLRRNVMRWFFNVWNECRQVVQ
jgi:hypothetical protein